MCVYVHNCECAANARARAWAHAQDAMNRSDHYTCYPLNNSKQKKTISIIIIGNKATLTSLSVKFFPSFVEVICSHCCCYYCRFFFNSISLQSAKTCPQLQLLHALLLVFFFCPHTTHNDTIAQKIDSSRVSEWMSECLCDGMPSSIRPGRDPICDIPYRLCRSCVPWSELI